SFPSDCLATPPPKLPPGSKTLAWKLGSTSPAAAGKIDIGSGESANDCAATDRLRHIVTANRKPARITNASIFARTPANGRSEQAEFNIDILPFAEPVRSSEVHQDPCDSSLFFTQAINRGEL